MRGNSRGLRSIYLTNMYSRYDKLRRWVRFRPLLGKAIQTSICLPFAAISTQISSFATCLWMFQDLSSRVQVRQAAALGIDPYQARPFHLDRIHPSSHASRCSKTCRRESRCHKLRSWVTTHTRQGHSNLNASTPCHMPLDVRK